jgi:hypothetical protein
MGFRKRKKEKVDLSAQLDDIGDRYDVSTIKEDVLKVAIPQGRKLVNDTIKKFELIDSLTELKNNLSNYNEFREELITLDLALVRSNVASAFSDYEKAKRKLDLKKKYGVELADKIIGREYFLGMTEEHLVEMRGNPSKIETEVLKTKTKLIYIYGNKSSGDIFNFVNGQLERFKDR